MKRRRAAGLSDPRYTRAHSHDPQRRRQAILDTLTAVERLGVALLVGLLIGLDRERSPKVGRGSLFAGVRTFPLIALTGALPMISAPPMSFILLGAAFIGVSLIAGIAYLRTSSAGDAGSTTEVAALATFLLGALAGAGELVIAAATGVAIAVLLHAKLHLERFSRALSREEVAAILELAVISVIVLPLMPRQGYGPWEVLNPFEIWLVVVLVSALSLIGFVAIRMVGESRGLAMTGFIGGLVSSTAITLSMAERSRAGAAAAGGLAAATVLASTIMCARIAVLAGVINAALLPRLVPVLLAMSGVGLAAARWLARDGGESKSGQRKLTNPFSLRRAITFGLIYAVVRLVVRAGQEWLGSAGLFVAAFLSALADVDAPTIAFARGGQVDGGWRVPAAAIAIAAVSNTLVKLVLAWSLGAGGFRKRAAVALGAMAIAGAAATAIVYAQP